MKTIFFTFILLLLPGGFFLAAQTGLPDSKRYSSELYIYKASVADLRKLNLKDNDPDETMLQSPITSYGRNEPVPPLPRGNYFIVGAEENHLVFNDHTVDDINFKFVPGEQFKLCLYDSTGHIIRNAKVKCGFHRLRFDGTTETYNCKKVKNEQIIEINNAGVFHYIDVKKGFNYSKNNFFKKEVWRMQHQWYSFLNGINVLFHPEMRPVKIKYTGFIVFNKPVYKPGETVKMKAYMTGINGRLYDKPLNVKLYANYPVKTDTTLIENLPPYRPGMFQYEFQLTGDLNLTLDNNYSIALQTHNKKENDLYGSFRYEEYELKNTRFSVETRKQEFAAGDTVIIKVKATDENEMALYGGRVELQVTPAPGTFDIKSMNKELSTFIPDVLWTETIEMNEVAEKEITIPDSIFPAGISLYYDVKCTYLSADNEDRAQTKRLFRNANDYLIDFSLDKGILTINELHKGVAQQTQATIKISGENGEAVSLRDLAATQTATLLEADEAVSLRDLADTRPDASESIVSLPCQFAAPWIASTVEVRTNNSQGTYSLKDILEEQLGYQFYRLNDSVFLKVDNPAQIPFWYTVRKNNTEIAKGYAIQLDYAVNDNGKDGYGMQLSYLFGKERHIESSLPQFKKNMTIDVSTPIAVYPGQKTTVTVSVSDKKGKPVENADITAYAFTSKFQNYATPSLKIKGKARYAKQISNASYNLDENGIDNKQSTLTWAYWRLAMSLDTIAYYRFLYPDIYYAYTEPSADGTTQIAPYVVINGALQGVHLLWIDDKLHYAEQSQQYAPYLFSVTPGTHKLRFRTHNREVTVYNFLIKEGMKTILSFDAGVPYYRGPRPPESPADGGYNSTAPFVLVSKLLKKKQQGRFSQKEIDYLSKQLITIDNNFGKLILPGLINTSLDLPVYLNAGNINYFLNPVERTQYNHTLRTHTNSPILAGPFPYRHIIRGMPDMVNVIVNRKPLTYIQFEGGYHYTVFENFQKMKSWEQSPLKKQAWPFAPQTDFKAGFIQENDIHNYFNNRIINHLIIGSDLLTYKPYYNTDKKNDCQLKLLLGVNRDGSLPKPAFFLLVPQNEKDITEYSLYMGNARDFRNLPEGNLNIHFIFADTTSFTTKLHLQSGGQNFLKLDSIGRDDNNKMAITAFNLFQQNLKTSSPQNLFLSAPMYDEFITKAPPLQQSALSNKNPSYVEGYDYNIILEENTNALEEVVVVGYGTQRRMAFTGAISSNNNSMPSQNFDQFADNKMAGLTIRDMVGSNAPPLIIINGLPYDGTLGDFDPDDIISINILKDQSAVSVYGARAANGVIMIQTKALIKEKKPEYGFETTEQGNSMRRNFHDDAFWQPALKSNKKGEASFEVTYPDDITNWQAHFLAIGNRKQADIKQINIHSFKALTAHLSVPRFAVRGDSLHAVGRIANYLNDTIEVRQIITHAGIRQENEIRMSTSHVQQIPVTVTESDSVTLAYSFSQTNGYFDGEERTIPVVEPGLLQSFGSFKIIGDTSTSTFDVDPDLGPVIIHAEASCMEVFRREIDRVDRYPYYCNEQMASKIKVLLSKKIICSLLNEPFKEDDKIRNLITRLNNNRNSDGMWGWWNKSATIGWITNQVINAMLEAEKAGYKTGIETEKLQSALERELKEGINAIPLLASFDTITVKQELLNRLIILKKLNARIDFPAYFSLINYHFKSTTLKEMELYALLGMNEKINTDTLFHYARHTMVGSMYWEAIKDNTFRLPSTTAIENTLTAYHILKHLGGYEKELEKIRNYFFECRHNASWQNTYHASRIIETIMQDMLDKDTTYSEAVMYIDNPNKRVTSFPHTEEINTKQPVQIRKEGTLPLFVTVYQQAWNPHPAPESSKGFTVKTRLCQGDGGIDITDLCQGDGGIDITDLKENRDNVYTLTAGKPAYLEVIVSIDSDADYVQIEAPIPAGCSYESKPTGFYGNEAHREHFKEKVSIFCNRLQKGEHRFMIELMPRFYGKYTLNPAKAELMYFPVFYGNETVKTINIDL